MIRASHLTKNYGPNCAVDDVSFEIEQGDIVGLLGPNGSGKTTIMRMLTGFFAPTDGGCEVAGVDVRSDAREARRHIGYLPERVALYPDVSVRAYLSFVARVHGVARANVRGHVDDAMERCGLGHMAKRYIGKLSRGYRQRVGIAQAVVHHPKVLILDEPTVGLDPRQIIEVRALIRQLAGESTVLLSTHILPEVSITCRRVLILDHGHLVAEDTAEGLVRKTAGRGETLVRVRAEKREAVAVFGDCRDVSSIEVVDTAPGGIVSVVVTTRGGEDPKPMLAAAAVERGWPLYEITARLITLEDLFVQILSEAGSAGGDAG